MEDPNERKKKAAYAAAAVGALIWGVCRLFSSSSNDHEMMNAPGRPGELIRRDNFENNPKDYFLKLREEGRRK